MESNVGRIMVALTIIGLQVCLMTFFIGRILLALKSIDRSLERIAHTFYLSRISLDDLAWWNKMNKQEYKRPPLTEEAYKRPDPTEDISKP